MSFTKYEKTPVQRRLIAAIGGHEKTGKTHLALTAPSPIWLFNLDWGIEGVIEKSDADIQIAEYTIDKSVVGTPGAKVAFQEQFNRWLVDYREALTEVKKNGGGTLILDTHTEQYEMQRLAHFGKLTQVMPHNYTEVNTEFQALVREAFDTPMCNLILIMKMNEIWRDGHPTGEYKKAGYAHMGGLVQATIMTKKGSERGDFVATIESCRQNPMAEGKEVSNPIFTWDFILNEVHGIES